MTDHYILNDKRQAVPCEDLIEWAKAYEGTRRVAATTIRDEIYVSTIFLGLDYSFGHGPPLLFETMVFGPYGDSDVNRYSTWEEAEIGHALLVAKWERKVAEVEKSDVVPGDAAQ